MVMGNNDNNVNGDGATGNKVDNYGDGLTGNKVGDDGSSPEGLIDEGRNGRHDGGT